MKNHRSLLWALFFIVLIAGGALTVFVLRDSLLQAQRPAPRNGAAITVPASNAVPPAGLVETLSPQPASQSSPADQEPPAELAVDELTQPFPAVDWSAPPACANQPQDVAALAQGLLAQGAAGLPAIDLNRAMQLSPRLASINQAQAARLFANLNTESGQQVLLSLAINIATGRINRETRVAFDSLPEVKTVGDLLEQVEAGLDDPQFTPALLEAGQQLLSGQGITQAVCAHLLVTQNGGQPADVQWSAEGMHIAAPAAITSLQAQQPQPVLDTVTVSPDGRRAAFTSIGFHTGGPLLVMEIQTGQWSNLIEKMNASRPAGQMPLPLTGWWDLIGWLPDSQRLVLGPSDASAFYIVDINSGAYEVLPFKGGGNGGAQFAGLAPNGSRLAFVELSADGASQVLAEYSLYNGQTRPLFEVPYSQGVLLYPRYAPDGTQLAYVLQQGTPESGYRYAIRLVDLRTGAARTLVEGNLGLSVPTWSPDGQYLAFTRKQVDEPDRYDPARPLEQPASNLWIAEIASGALSQVTFVEGQARRPVWGSDARTLSFITHDGQVGLVDIRVPGHIWRAAAAAQDPLLTSAFFIP